LSEGGEIIFTGIKKPFQLIVGVRRCPIEFIEDQIELITNAAVEVHCQCTNVPPLKHAEKIVTLLKYYTLAQSFGG